MLYRHGNLAWHVNRGVRTAHIMRYAHTRKCPYTRGYRTKKSKCMFSRSTPLHHRSGIYKYPICQSPFSPKGSKSKSFKIFFVDRFFIVDRVYIYTGIIVMFFILPHIKIWLPKKGFVYLHRKFKK